jgi:hypothetical protein
MKSPVHGELVVTPGLEFETTHDNVFSNDSC